MIHLEQALAHRLTRGQYVGLLGQLYHVAVAAPVELHMAADHLPDHALAQRLRRHGSLLEPEHHWLADDLADLGRSVPLPSSATRRLLDELRHAAAGDRAYRMLALPLVLQGLWQQADAERLLPEDAGAACRYVLGCADAAWERGAELDQTMGLLSPDEQAEARQQARVFGELLLACFTQSTDSAPAGLVA